MFLTIITFLIVFSLLIFAHELGHFWFARKFGVRAEEFGFGFPPRIWGIYKNKEEKWKWVRGRKEVEDAASTIYSINWIPIGGFVKIKGENGENENEPDSFASLKIWQRAAILSAGVSMNVILAAVLISLGLMIGFPQVLDNLDSHAKVSDKKIQIVQIIPDSPAAETGLMVGDTIITINDKEFAVEGELQDFVGGQAGQELVYKIKRGREEMTLEIVPEIREETGRGGIGIAIATTGLVKYPWYLAIEEGIKTTIILIWVIIVAFYELIKGYTDETRDS